ncbi:uncharacterized protein A4U43_C10F13170 [Asparagus officinalis]|uniref:Uncharacterized protein n=1 Tax=Asparagus officinalis TaxID=4686 RepID=A0A5P1E5S8_ASPOF|nr:uncharacterized protein A4U43_C10F13170 [Asparagus officinalis]
MAFRVRDEIQKAISNARMKKKVDDKARGRSISEKKDLIWSLQKQHRHTRVRFITGKLTPEEFDLGDTTLYAMIQTEKDDVQALQWEAFIAAALTDIQL